MTEKMNTFAQTADQKLFNDEAPQGQSAGLIRDINALTAVLGADQQKLTWRMPRLDKQIKEMYVTNSGASSASSSVLPTQMITEKDIKDMIPEGGLKYDNDKPRMDLLDFDALEGLAKVLTFGAKKYDEHNWRNGISYSRLTAAMLRHLAALQRGEDIDAESGLPHIDHLGCCWMFLSNMTKTRPDLDDRYKDAQHPSDRSQC